MNQMIMPIVSKVAIIGFFTLMLCGCGGRQEREQSEKPQSLTQTEVITGKESSQMQEQKVDGLQQSTGGSVQNPLRGDVYYEYKPVFSPEEIRKQMVGKWRFHIDSIETLSTLGSSRNSRYSVQEDVEVIIQNTAKGGDSCDISIPALFFNKFVHVPFISPAYENGDENEDGYGRVCFADFQIAGASEEIEELTGYVIIAIEGIFLSSQKWRGMLSIQSVHYYGTAHRVK